jgi:hypothetical protein
MASKADYLKKYLSGSDQSSETTTKKKKKIKKIRNVTIHDDDLDWSNLAPKQIDLDDDPGNHISLHLSYSR